MTWKMFAFPAVAAAVVATLAVLPGAEPEARAPRPSIVTQSAYACPTPGGTSVAAGRIRAHAGASSTALALPGERPVTGLESVERWNVADVDGHAVVISTTDAKGAGAVGFVAGTGASKDGGGFGVSSCPGVTQDAWYLGAGSGGRHFSTLTLTNLADGPAVADVTMWGDEGSVDAIDAEGIVLDPFETRRIKLDDLAAGEPELVVHVESRRGALSVSLKDTSEAVFSGSEPMAPTAEPARRFIVPGIVAGSSGRQLLVFNPGDSTARVKVESLGKDGPFTPTGLEGKKVPAGRLTVIDLPSSAGGAVTALRLTSDQPVAASVRMSPSNKDFAYAVAGPRLAGPALLPLAIGDRLDDIRLLLTAPGSAGRVEVTAYDEKMVARGSVDIEVGAGSSRSYDLRKKGRFDEPLRDLAYVIVTPSGTVHGAGLYEKGSGLSTVPLVAAPLTTFAPDVRPAR